MRRYREPGAPAPEKPPVMPVWVAHGRPPYKPRKGSERERILALLKVMDGEK